MESYRTERGPRQWVVAYLGDVAEGQRLGGASRQPAERRAGATLSEGCYLLRSNITDWDAEQLWRAYIQLTEAEAAFRLQKGELRIRPIWHQKEERVQAHILVCFLAYVLSKMLGQTCKSAGLGNEPREVLDEIAQIKAVDVALPTKTGHGHPQALHRPAHQAILLQVQGLHFSQQMKIQDI